MTATPDCELHELFGGRLTIWQPAAGYRFSIDSVLLAAFARRRLRGRVADLGTGCGVLPVLLARSPAVSSVLGIEIQPELAGLAQRNIELNACRARADILCADIRAAARALGAGSFDAVVANPPFYRAGSGRMSPGAQKAAARHEVHGTIADFMAAAAALVKQGGACAVVYGAARLADLVSAMRSHRLEPKALRFVHGRRGEPAAMVLAEAVKGAGVQVTVEPPLVLYGQKGGYTREAQRLFADV